MKKIDVFVKTIDESMFFKLIPNNLYADITTQEVDSEKYDISLVEKERKKVTNPPVEKFYSGIYQDEKEDFMETILKNWKEEDLNFLFRNIFDVEIVQKEKDENYPTKTGGYDVISNRISLYGPSDAIYHELFHMASSYYIKLYGLDLLYSGFSQTNNKYSIGTGLNEGYTDYLTYVFYPDPISLGHSSYSYEMITAELIAYIVGRERTKSLYMNADLLGLIKELEKYISRKQILTFIRRLDIHTEKKGDYTNPEFLEEKKQNIKEIYAFLVNLVNNYLIYNKKDTPDEFIDRCMNFLRRHYFKGIGEVEIITKEESNIMFTKKRLINKK